MPFYELEFLLIEIVDGTGSQLIILQITTLISPLIKFVRNIDIWRIIVWIAYFEGNSVTVLINLGFKWATLHLFIPILHHFTLLSINQNPFLFF